MLRTLPNIDNFDGLLSRSISYEVQGEKLWFASIGDLIAMKQAAGRTKDLEHIRQLEAIKKLKAES